TFVFSYLQEHGVKMLTPRLRSRGLSVVLVGLAFLGVVIGIGSFLIPRVVEQAQIFVEKFPSLVRTVDQNVIDLSGRYPILQNIFAFQCDAAVEPIHRLPSEESSPTALLIRYVFGYGEAGEGNAGLRKTIDILRNIGSSLVAIGSAFLLSLLFSFLIVLDLPRLKRGLDGLSRTKLNMVLDEVGPGIYNFGLVLGRALEAQLFIAIANTTLTALIIHYLGIADKVAFLSLIVFLCSFIPVAGVFISSIPICLLVLAESGVSMVLLAILLIWVVHLIEAYVLNPRIFGHHLRLNPVIVLIILTVCGKLFHFWGLILGLPVATYLFRYAIQPADVRERELEAAEL
ncbi:MAG: AI-2E family transporter, partial [Bdellovibrionales bacterium]|nr:AI-2E family transporter [Bdellovibrionales bacterium]